MAVTLEVQVEKVQHLDIEQVAVAAQVQPVQQLQAVVQHQVIEQVTAV